MESLPKIQNWIYDLDEENEEIKKKENKEELFCQTISTETDVCLLNLPNEIILKIFSYLDTYSRIKVKLVCKRLKTVVEDPSIWKYLSFKEQYDMSHIPIVIEKCCFLEHLRIVGGVVDASILCTVHCLSRLQSISFHFSTISTDCIGTFRKIMSSLKNLKFLDLEGCIVSMEVLDTIQEAKNLQHLNLSHCFHLSDESLIAILENCRKLKLLDLDGINLLNPHSIDSIFRICSKTLVGVILDGENLCDNTFSLIESCSLLSQLCISFCDNITDTTLHRLKKLPHLKSLKLRKGVALTAGGLQNMFKSGSMSKLTHLNLTECSNFDDSGLITVSETCTELKTLNLSWCWELTDHSVDSVVRKCQKLEVMNLTGVVHLEGTFLAGLQLNYLKNLKLMILEQCGAIEEDELSDIVELRPNLKILGYWGDIIEPFGD